MLHCDTRFAKYLWFCALAAAFWSASAGLAPGATDDEVRAVRFDAVIELNAPLCRTHVVLFARYWVTADSYRVAVVWAEPNAGALNFPIYPPTLNVASDPNGFAISHQFLHMYDGDFARPLARRGPFRHRFNSYHFSDVRFAERDALDLRIGAGDLGAAGKKSAEEGERTVDVTRPSGELARLKVRTRDGRLAALDLLDARGDCLKSIEYEYAGQDGAARLQSLRALLPQRPITVGFKGEGPAITIGGVKRHYRQLETTHHAGGRACTVEYRQVDLRGRTVTLPSRVTVRSQDGTQVLRSARFENFVPYAQTPDRVKQVAQDYSLFDAAERECRDLLVKYWVREPADVNEIDVERLRGLRRRFAAAPTAGGSMGERLKRVNLLLQTDWMLGDTKQLQADFREYLALLRTNDLGRMVLFGGQHAIETTIRWGYIDAADGLLRAWLDAAVSGNDVQTMLDFAEAGLARRRLWTLVNLMDEVLEKRQPSPPQRFAAHALRALALARICEMLEKPDYIKTELGVAQARWLFARTDADEVRQRLARDTARATHLFAGLQQPTRQQKILKTRLDKLGAPAQEGRAQDDPGGDSF